MDFFAILVQSRTTELISGHLFICLAANTCLLGVGAGPQARADLTQIGFGSWSGMENA